MSRIKRSLLFAFLHALFASLLVALASGVWSALTNFASWGAKGVLLGAFGLLVATLLFSVVFFSVPLLLSHVLVSALVRRDEFWWRMIVSGGCIVAWVWLFMRGAEYAIIDRPVEYGVIFVLVAVSSALVSWALRTR